MTGHLWLIGMMGAGKSAAGRRLAKRLDLLLVDIDETVADRMGCSIAQLWGDLGEAAFRQMEAAAVAAAAAGPPSVIATGGGVILDPANVAAMQASGRVVWLTGRVESLARRVGTGGTRPLLADTDPIARLGDILAERRGRYEAAADFVIATDQLTSDEVVARIEAWWNES